MSIKPIDIMMTIAQSQNLKPPEPADTVKHAYQATLIAEQQIKNKESIVRIPNDDTTTESMEIIKQGMPNPNGDTSSQNQQEKSQEHDYPEKALLDDDNGHSLDIIS